MLGGINHGAWVEYADGQVKEEIKDSLTDGIEDRNQKARNSSELRAYLFLERKIPTYVEHGNFASRKFARSPPDERACYKLCLCISERRNRTRACYARRAAPTDNQNTPKAMNDFRGILVTRTGIEPMFPA